ncbi:MAG: hypothetical protein Kow0065_11940 [Methylomicrobium sp.]
MPVFILSCLSISYLADNQHPLHPYLLSPIIIPVFGALMAIFGVGLLTGKPRSINWHDLFATSALFVWFAYWHRFFDAEAPMFVYFPLFLAIIALSVLIFFIGQRRHIDAETRQIMQSLAERHRLLSLATVGFVLLSLFLIDHFLLFPIAMTLFVIKFSLIECVKHDV